MLEAGEGDIAYKDGHFEVVGTDRRITLFETAARAAEMKKRGEIAEDLDTRSKTETPLSFPNGCHIAEIEIDPDTGRLTVVAYSAVDDCGRPLDHTIVEGQLHGSLMQGLGQALMENTVFDRDSGQLSPARSWTTPCRAPRMRRRCATPCIMCRRRPIRSASKASAKPAPPPASRR